jgi:hypothetical protein
MKYIITIILSYTLCTACAINNKVLYYDDKIIVGDEDIWDTTIPKQILILMPSQRADGNIYLKNVDSTGGFIYDIDNSTYLFHYLNISLEQ